MKTTMLVLTILTISLFTGVRTASAQAEFGISVDNGQVRSFHIAMGDYYRVPERDVIYVEREGIPEDEIPVVLFISRHSGYAPAAIIRMRHSGRSWVEISNRCGIEPDAYYIAGAERSGPPYGNAYGYRRNHGQIVLTDDDIVRGVNVHFLADRYHRDQSEIYRLRSNGRGYRSIYGEFEGRHDQHSERNDHDGYRGHQGNGNGKGHGKGHGNGHGNGKHKGWGDD